LITDAVSYKRSNNAKMNAVQPSDKVDSQWFFLRGRDHGEARIKNMSAEEKQRLITTLEKWLSIKID